MSLSYMDRSMMDFSSHFSKFFCRNIKRQMTIKRGKFNVLQWMYSLHLVIAYNYSILVVLKCNINPAMLHADIVASLVKSLTFSDVSK